MPPPGAVLFATSTPAAPRRRPAQRPVRMPNRASAVSTRNRAAWRLCLAAVLLGGVAATEAAAQTVTLSVPAGTSLAEDGGSQDVEVTATLSSARTSATEVTLSLSGTARSTDYAVQSLPTITIPANGTTASGTLIIAAVDDNFWELDESIEVSGRDRRQGGAGDGAAGPVRNGERRRGDDTGSGRLGDRGGGRGLHGVVVAGHAADHGPGGVEHRDGGRPVNPDVLAFLSCTPGAKPT